eukprot:Gb_09961 [translate_table: standard]
MPIWSITVEVVTSITPKRLWMALAMDSPNFLPMALPNIYSGGCFIEGDGGVGTIKKFDFTDANKDLSYEKERVDEIIEKDFLYRYTALEGGLMGKKLRTAKFEMKISPTDDEGCLLKWTCNFETVSNKPPSEAQAQELKAEIVALVKMVESYLLSNPELYL